MLKFRYGDAATDSTRATIKYYRDSSLLYLVTDIAYSRKLYFELEYPKQQNVGTVDYGLSGWTICRYDPTASDSIINTEKINAKLEKREYLDVRKRWISKKSK